MYPKLEAVAEAQRKENDQGEAGLRNEGRAGQMLVNYRGGAGRFPYVSAVDIMIKARTEAPTEQADFTHLQAKAKDQLSTLQGPQLDSTQGSVDDLLASLGM